MRVNLSRSANVVVVVASSAGLIAIQTGPPFSSPSSEALLIMLFSHLQTTQISNHVSCLPFQSIVNNLADDPLFCETTSRE